MKLLSVFALFSIGCMADLVREVRADIANNDFTAGEDRIAEFNKRSGWTPESILAYSWLGRGAQAAKKWDRAEAYASETRRLCLDALKTRKLDDEPMLPLALGASIEVQGNTLAGRGQRSEAVAFLRNELKKWYDTSIRTRNQKNLNLLSLEGSAALPLLAPEYLGAKPPGLEQLKGKPVVLFFWAHWCGDCKATIPVLSRIQKEFGAKGLTVVGPTQRYGYTARGKEAPPEEELKYIDEVRKQYYSPLGGMPVPVSEENFKAWGSSTSPTLVLLDRKGMVQLYHPGKMSYEELVPHVERAVN
jgi:thiol-disulfide isomerase/thioredoxin